MRTLLDFALLAPPSARATRLLVTIIGTAFAGCASTTAVPIRHAVAGTYLVIPADINGHSATLMLDTGSEHVVISKQFSDHIGLAGGEFTNAAAINGQGANQILTGQITSVESFKVGSLEVIRKSGQVLISEIANVGGPTGETIDGLLGNSILTSADYVLDVRNPSLVIVRKLKFPATSLTHRFRDARYRTYLPVEINGRAFEFILDTGSNASFVTREAFESLGNVQAENVQARVDTVFGRTTQSTTKFHARVRVGDVEMPNVTLYVGAANLLGLDLLRFGRLSLSAQQGLFSFVTQEGGQ